MLFKKSGKNNTSNFSVLFILLLNAFYKIVSIVNTCGIELIKYTGKRGMLMLALGVGVLIFSIAFAVLVGYLSYTFYVLTKVFNDFGKIVENLSTQLYDDF